MPLRRGRGCLRPLSEPTSLELYRSGATVRATDDTETAALAFAYWTDCATIPSAVSALLADERIWGQDLTAVRGLTAEVVSAAETIAAGRLESAMANVFAHGA